MVTISWRLCDGAALWGSWKRACIGDVFPLVLPPGIRGEQQMGGMSMKMRSEALGRIGLSATVRVSQLARDLMLKGRDIVSLSAGEPDFDTPEPIRQAAVRAIEAGRTRYTGVQGIVELRQAVAAKFFRDNGLEVSAEQCFVSAGGKQIIFNAMLATLNRGDEVVVPAPYWVSYPDIVRLAGATPVFVPCDEGEGFKLGPEKLEAAIGPKTRWLILNSPSNPTGAVYSAGELAALGDVLRRFGQVHVLSDDIYEQLVYGGAEFATLAGVCPDLAPRIVTLNGVSKSHAMTGWRIGYCTGPATILEAMGVLQSQSTNHACSISQWAAVEALNGDQGFLDEWRAVFQARRDMVVGALNAIEGIGCLTPQGAFYVFPSIAGLLGRTSAGGRKIASDADFVMALLEEKGVALVQGSAFGLPGHFRLSYAASNAQLKTAMARIGDFCAGLR